MSDYISQDLLVLILKRLPVKTRLRFKCVCKSWKQLIVSTSFTLQHLAVQSPCFIRTNSWNNSLNLLDPHTLPLISNITVTVPSGTERRHTVFVSMVHGVICYLDDFGSKSIILWNPSIHQHFRFPLPCGRSAYSDCHGFWIDLGIGEKVAHFSSRKGEWMEVGMDEIIGDNYEPDGKPFQVMVDGVAYWKASYLGFSLPSTIIISSDFGQDKFGTIELPFSVPQKYINICNWRGSLSVVHWNIGSSNRCDLWVMQHGSWSIMFSFNLVTRLRNIFCVLESCGRVLALTGSRDLVLCDPSGSCCITLEHRFVNQSAVAYDFVESLVLPDTICISID